MLLRQTFRSYGVYAVILPWFLLGYALSGRAFAYIGVGNIYVGELLLMVALISMLRTATYSGLLFQPQAWALACFMLWSALQTIPYIGEYGIYAFRDGVLWGYGLFAFATAQALIMHPAVLSWFMRHYQLFAHYFPYFALVGMAALLMLNKETLDVTWYIQMKPGDVLVHLAAIFAFAACGLMASKLHPLWIIACVLLFVMAGSGGRGGLLAFLLAAFVLLALRFRHPATWRFMAVAVLLVLVAAITLPQVTWFQHYEAQRSREISPTQIGRNLLSVLDTSDVDALEGTRRFRLEWWDKIWRYTVEGPYFMGGKGYGINLAVSDGQVPSGDISVRHPHNVHMNVLARSGVPGLLLWVLVHIMYMAAILRAVISAKLRNLRLWEGVFTTLLMFHIAALVNASFDVYLEGPMGGIWFWVMMGVGMGGLHLYRTMPHLLTPEIAGRA